MRWCELALWLVAVGAFAYTGVFYGRMFYQQTRGDWVLNQLSDQQPSVPERSLEEGSLVGRIEISEIGLSAIVFEGTTADVLGYGVGHLSGSALPGTFGNAVFAAHRDTFFRPLRDIRKGNVIVLVTPQGEFRYVAESTTIVKPEQTEVLRATPDPTLTLITCYPFQYVGHAPQRFIVRARSMSSPGVRVMEELRETPPTVTAGWSLFPDKPLPPIE